MSDQHHEEPHDDFGGLHRDLKATLDRRGLLRLGARFGAAFGALQLVGCGDSPTVADQRRRTRTTTTTTHDHHTAIDHDGRPAAGFRRKPTDHIRVTDQTGRPC